MNSSAGEARAPLSRRFLKGWISLVRHMLPPTIFFFVGFNLILWTMHMALAEHGIDVQGFATATVAALLVGKAVLLTDELPFMSRFDGRPLIQPILFKTVIYWMCVFVVRLADIMAHYAVDHHTLSGFVAYLVNHFRWRKFIAIQVWLMALFMLYVTLHELNVLFGNGELYRLFFRWYTTQAKLTRRSRIRMLTRLNHLTEANSVSAMSQPGSPAYDELVTILKELARSSDAPVNPRPKSADDPTAT